MKLHITAACAFTVAAAALTGCANHDLIPDKTEVGQAVPTVYWEVGSTVCKAGESFTFQGKYTNEPGRTPLRSEVWYQIIRTDNAAVSAKLAGTSLSYTQTVNAVDTMRSFQCHASYPHQESYWDGLLEYPQYTRPEVWEGRAVPEVLLGGDHAKIDAWRGEQSRTRTRLRRPELYEQWCMSHPIAEVPKWKRGENVRLVKTAEQFAAAAKLFAEGRQTVCADNWTPEYCRTLTEPQFLLQLQQEKAAGWVCYLHTTKDVPDGMVCVSHKAGHIEHLFVTEKARGNGIGAKLLDFARKKLPEHAHPVLSVLNTNTRAIALYTRMGWQLDGSTSLEFDPQQYPTVTRKCALVQMRYAGPAQE